jgi:hypothetical protein
MAMGMLEAEDNLVLLLGGGGVIGRNIWGAEEGPVVGHLAEAEPIQRVSHRY